MAPVIVHLVLMTPKPELTAAERTGFVDAFEAAVRQIPQVRSVRIGRRIRLGAAYEQLSSDAGDYLAWIEFADRDGLDAYLRHPAHADVGSRFYQVLSSALVFDYDVGGLELLREL